MKFLLTLFVLLFSLTSNAKNYETEIIPGTSIIAKSDFVQIDSITNATQANQNYQGLDFYDSESYRYNDGNTSGRYGKNIIINKQVVSKANHSKIETSKTHFTKNREYDTGGLRMFGITRSRQNLQGNYYTSTRDYYSAAGNYHANTKGNSCYSKAFDMGRRRNIVTACWKCGTSLF